VVDPGGLYGFHGTPPPLEHQINIKINDIKIINMTMPPTMNHNETPFEKSWVWNPPLKNSGSATEHCFFEFSKIFCGWGVEIFGVQLISAPHKLQSVLKNCIFSRKAFQYLMI